jgi:hypothetical protein
MLIEQGDTHEILPTNKPLETLSINFPPAYKRDGTENSAGCH